jgi:hypothetical protein
MINNPMLALAGRYGENPSGPFDMRAEARWLWL